MAASVVILTDIARVVRSAFGGREKMNEISSSGSSRAIDLADGNVQVVTLTDDCQFTFTGANEGESCSFVLKLKQDGQGMHQASFPAGTIWPGGEAPTLSTDPGALDKLVFESTDGGQTWEGNVAGIGYE